MPAENVDDHIQLKGVSFHADEKKSQKIDEDNKGVLVIYTGGTIGSLPVDPGDPESPQIVVDWKEFVARTPEFNPEHETFIGFKVDAYSFDEPLDSCNVGPDEWIMMASIIEKHHEDYEGFVILHGTDTMIYSASALSFMLVNLKRPVIITGAQITHLFNSCNDGKQNMIRSLLFANPQFSKIPLVPEVCIFFDTKLLRGNRTRKQNSSGFDAYFTPNYPPLGEAGGRLVVDEILTLKPNDEPFRVVKRLEENVLTFDVYPGIQNTNLARNILKTPKISGVVLRAFGTGNIPTKPEFLDVFRHAHQNEILVQNVTQCLFGFVELGMYETSAELLEMGMVTGFDITPEAALCKLMVLLANERLSFSERAETAQRSIAGEMSRSLYIHRLFSESDKIKGKKSVKQYKETVLKCDRPIHLEPDEIIDGDWRGDRILNASLRLYGATIELEKDNEHIGIEVYLVATTGKDLSSPEPKVSGFFKRRVTSVKSGREMIVGLDITLAAREIVRSGVKVYVTLKIREGTGTMSWNRSELALFINERVS